ncbi:DUF948 domain-containing protein [Oceanobacillus piezotolerans]|uniref:DUF948 domain-containing protein n=1 Tax=Oceanobacillus piezotolerans TaxID=2448030 RepID=A0A498DHC8_9BACI|nr:DUF948 domain-containing protein [Oceanobacillus piezotolerans]RLL39948.1 DUF948 domain-containing protein [Oceanobacillus piezotolerans]
MTLVGIGVIIIGIALLILAIFIGHALNNLANVLKGVDKTVERLPNQLDDIMKKTGDMISESNNTLADVNDKLHQLSPLFYVVGDVGNVTRKFSSSLVNVTESAKVKTESGVNAKDKNKLGGAYGTFALGYYWLKKRKERKRQAGSFDEA